MVCSSFNGVIEEIPGISVDNFERPEEVKARAYFLSHCHTDHTQGLFTDRLMKTLEETKACIYMSEVTAAVIEHEGGLFFAHLKEYIRPLKLGNNSVTLPPVPSKNLPELQLNVILMSAAHCLGSIMYLFQTETKNVLFTGDFRVTQSDVSKIKHLHDKNWEPITIDAMYVDTTFIGLDYTDFPKRSESMEATIDEIKRWLAIDNNNMVALHTSAKYGYEYVFNEIYTKLKMKLYVDEDRWLLYSKILDRVPGVTNEEHSSRIHICRNSSADAEHTKCLKETKNKKFLFIHFSAMKWRNYEVECKSIERVAENRLHVCYATHCSRSEILYFVNYFSPNRTIGFPNKFDSSSSLKSVSADFVEFKPLKRILKPSPKNKNEKVRKVDNETLRKLFED